MQGAALGDHAFGLTGQLVALAHQAVKFGGLFIQIDRARAGHGLGPVIPAGGQDRRIAGPAGGAIAGHGRHAPFGPAFQGESPRQIAFGFRDQPLDRAQIAGVGADALFLLGAAGGKGQNDQQNHSRMHDGHLPLLPCSQDSGIAGGGNRGFSAVPGATGHGGLCRPGADLLGQVGGREGLALGWRMRAG